MTHFRRMVALAVLLGPGAPLHAAASADSARCEVWQRETSFAQSVARHDAVAFAEHLHPQAAFGVSRTPTVGREAIVREWQGIIDGSALRLEWYPDVVTVGGDGDTAYSSGPSLYTDPKTGSVRRGRFGSVWQRDGDGAWRVIFDDGIRPEPADAAAVQAFHAGRRPACSSD
jgi:ketosteroid isomerase-like protein